MFFKRNYSPEIMDDVSLQDERIDSALAELKNINRFLGGNSVTKKGFEYLSKRGGNHAFLVLDAGAGGSDLFTKIQGLKVIPLDKNKRVCKYIISKGGTGTPVCADIFYPPFKEKSFDIIHCALLLHHFSGTDSAAIIRTFINLSVCGIIINDLRRSIFAYLGIKILTVLFSKSEMVKNDAPLSVRKGFNRKELTDIMKELNITDYILKRKWAFRWLLIIYIK